MERTRDIESDPDAVRRHDARNDGKRLLASLREDKDFDLRKALKAIDRDRRTWVREGLFEAAVHNLTLPQSEADLERLGELEPVFQELARDRGMVRQLMQQVREFFSQYLSERQKLIEELHRRYEPRLKQKQQQLSQQYGREVSLDPASDPEFSKALQDNLGSLQEHYRRALSEVEEHLRRMVEL